MANNLPKEKKILVISGLANGMSIRAASRVFGVHQTTILRLLERVGSTNLMQLSS